MKKALIVWGGWSGHEPELVAGLLSGLLQESGFEIEISPTLEAFADKEKLLALDLIVPIWTMGDIRGELVRNVSEAVQAGVGLAGCHGGMCDAFRSNVDWQFMTGGNWVAHPGNDGVEYVVQVPDEENSILRGIGDFRVRTEQYYLHVDPAVEVLATTRFPLAPGPHSLNKPVDMPVAWTKRWGVGRVYYCSLGHHADVLEIPQAKEMMRRGLLWAAEGKKLAQEQQESAGTGDYTGMGDSIV
ncbi:hypothetical protein SAMN02799630_01092 [Paenibacillus sp. UNCCL117]|uniref:ThuA domain-containing protein n=1 Tax=unclassified Paenibacillus TaxID=185978 RepID=UPI00087E6EDF|nr:MULTISPECIES: ThuA domain-containing protein [unclassified Paenibacillus]SDC65535.1 hypothetical protein SAMN04488602_10370 [Paenibacillus sp. cl123]SFW22790.1 hypothetical protein SAMN02799630_01092 [Paenibacillus sp. UNCCL117]